MGYRSSDILRLKIRIITKYFFLRRALSEHIEDVFHANAHSTNAGMPPTLFGFDRDPTDVTHESIPEDEMSWGSSHPSQVSFLAKRLPLMVADSPVTNLAVARRPTMRVNILQVSWILGA